MTNFFAMKAVNPRKRYVKVKHNLKNTFNIKKPKRALSVYNIYFREERIRILASIINEEAPDVVKDKISMEKSNDLNKRSKRGRPRGPNYMKKVPHHKIGFEDLAKRISARWQSVKDEYNTKYEAVVKEDKERYRKEMKIYRELLKKEHLKQSQSTVREHNIEKDTNHERKHNYLTEYSYDIPKDYTSQINRNTQNAYVDNYNARGYDVNRYYSHLHCPENIRYSYHSFDSSEKISSNAVIYENHSLASPGTDFNGTCNGGSYHHSEQCFKACNSIYHIDDIVASRAPKHSIVYSYHSQQPTRNSAYYSDQYEFYPYNSNHNHYSSNMSTSNYK